MSDTVRMAHEGSVRTITISRPDKRNALSNEVVSALLAELDAAAQDDTTRVVVLTGEGKTFSAGADLAALEGLQEASYQDNLADSQLLARLFEAIYRHPRPIIARVNGHAVAGGCGLAAACDLSIAVDHARLGFTEVRIGFVPAIVSVFIVPKIGEGAARDLFLTGRLIGAHEAAQIGLISEVVAAEDLDGRVRALTEELSRETSIAAVAQTKALLADLRGQSFDEALAHAAETNAGARMTEDCRAGVRAFLEKKDPPWRRA